MEYSKIPCLFDIANKPLGQLLNGYHTRYILHKRKWQIDLSLKGYKLSSDVHVVLIVTFANSNYFVRNIAATWYLSFEKVTCVVIFLIGDTGIISNWFISLKNSFGLQKSLNAAHCMSHVNVPGRMAKRRPVARYLDLKLDFGPEFGIRRNAYFVSYNGRNSR